MAFLLVSGLLAICQLVAAQQQQQTNFTGVTTVTADQVALISYNVSAHENSLFEIYDPSFKTILGPHPIASTILTAPQPYFHETGVFFSDSPVTIYVTSNQFNTSSPSPSTNNKQIVVSRITQNASTGAWSYDVLPLNTNVTIPLPNGGFPYKDGVLFTVQGTLTQPAGLVYVDFRNKTYPTTTVINNYLGREFNSPNDVHVSPAGDIYFTDPAIGYNQNIRPAPVLPNTVYAYRPGTTQIRALTDGVDFTPNGIVFSPDYKTAYVTNSPIPANPAVPRAIYAFDVIPSATGRAAPGFGPRRLFAYPPAGFGDGIKADSNGNIYIGVGDGINVWNPDGVLIGKIATGFQINNFCFGTNGRLFVFQETSVLLAQLSPSLQPAVLPVINSQSY